MAGSARIAVVVAVLSFLHFALRPAFTDWSTGPNLLVCGLLLSARHVRPAAAAGIGFALGLLEDAVAVSYFGFSTIAFTLLGYAGSRTRDLFLGDEPFFVGAYVFAGTWLVEVATQLLPGRGEPVAMIVFAHAPLVALITALVGYVVRPALTRP